MNRLERSPDRSTTRVPLIRSYVQDIAAPPATVFPLLCPVREGEWLEGWAEGCELVWSASGLAELGCVFRTFETGWPDTVCIVSEHDPDRGVVRFVRVTPGLVASLLCIEVSGADEGRSSVAIHYEVVPTSPEGEAYAAARYDRADLLASVVWWERSMNHYLRTGQMLRRDPAAITSIVRADAPDTTDKE